MTRAGVSFILSVVLHAALLTLLTIPSARIEPSAAGAIRVTFNSPARAESAGAVSGAQKIEPIPEPQPQPKPASTRPPKKRRETNRSAAAPTMESAPLRSTPELAASTPQKGGREAEANAVLPTLGPSGDVPSGSQPTVVDAKSLKATKKVSPEYPMLSRKRKEQGTVVLLIQIASGVVRGVKVERSSGHPPLDESATRAVKQWAFDTYGFGNDVVARISFKFELK
jgi:protein TonB